MTIMYKHWIKEAHAFDMLHVFKSKIELEYLGQMTLAIGSEGFVKPSFKSIVGDCLELLY